MNVEDALHYEPDSGALTWKVSRGKAKRGDAAGTKHHDGGIQVSFLGKLYQAHRLAWFLTYGVWPTADIDHINGNRSDNRLCNLRDVSRSTNLQNQRRPRLGSGSPYLGVSYHKAANKWHARICVDGKTINLGLHDEARAAHIAYINAKRSFHAGNTI